MTLLDRLIEKGINVPATCGGLGRCGHCLVKMEHPASPDEIESSLIAPRLLRLGYRLACRRGYNEHHKIMQAVSKIKKPTRTAAVGVTLDIGTTAIKGVAIDLRNRKVLSRAAVFNPQNSLGGDVMTRIGLALDGKYRVLRDLLFSGIKTVNRKLGQPKPIFMTIVGNPVMLSFYLNKSVAGLAHYPFQSEINNGVFLKNPNRYIFPVIGSFVGGDTIAGLLAGGVMNKKGIIVYLDLGTNGEVVIKDRNKIFATSTAAGPAFEGAGIKGGSLAVSGAIDRVSYKKGFRFRTIDDSKPVGFCASGLLDLLAVLLRKGWLRPDGRLLRQISVAGIKLHQPDIRMLQLAIGAIHTGFEMLVAKCGVRPSNIDEVILTGEFGSRLNPHSLKKVGLIPVGAEKIRFERDLPLRGGTKFLLDESTRRTIKEIKRKSTHLELALESDFQKKFIRALRLEPWG